MKIRILIFAAVLAATTSPASAEWAVDLYGGGAFTERADVATTFRLGVFNQTFNAEDARFDASPAYGGRVGYWLERFPWLGLGVDAMHFHREIPRQSLRVTLADQFFGEFDFEGPRFSTIAVSLLPMLRWPLLVDAEHPQGLVQPYIFAGPTVFLTELRDDPITGGNSKARTLGLTAGGGVAFPVLRWLSLFGEYRYTRERASFDLEPGGGIIVPSTVETTFNTHHLLFGASLRW